MTRNLKALGLALIAAFAMSAIAASAAQAEGASTLTPASYPAWLTTEAKGNQKYVTNTGEVVECTGVGGHSTIEKAGVGDTVVTATNVSYSGCSVKVGTGTFPGTINMTGCDFKSSGVQTDPGDSTHYINGKLEISCPAGVTGPDVKVFETAAKHAAGTALCNFTMWATVSSGTLTATNVAGSPNDILGKANNIVTPVTRSGSILCGNPTSATYNGESTIKAYEDLGEEGGKPKEGNQIGLTVSHL